MTELRAHCKINLGLRVARRRADGFHDIETVMVPVRGVADTVSVTAFPDSATFPGGGFGPGGGLSDPFPFLASTPPSYPSPPPVFPTGSVLELSGLEVDCPPGHNICMKALRLLQQEFGIGEGLVRLHKVIPAGAGLGGGSSDAAAVLRAANEEFVLELSDPELEELAARLGSDVAFFVRDGARFCTSRGEIMTPVEVDLAGKWLVIVKPPVAVSTAEAYAGVTPREGGDLSPASRVSSLSRPDAGLPLPLIVQRPVEEWRELLINDFEESVFARHPGIGALKRALYDAGALYASMSGSGSAVFAIFDRRPDGFNHDGHGRGQKTGLPFLHIEQLR
jgi:4-diphosphocytidyl-2-C-methyl-D-erythritol kinase